MRCVVGKSIVCRSVGWARTAVFLVGEEVGSSDFMLVALFSFFSLARRRYLLDASRYTASLISLCCFEHKRKDFRQMFVHHVVTVVITLVSYQIDFNRVGAVVKLLMDPADVPLHGAKLCKYCGLEFIADRCFELFALSFFVTRLVMYGYVVKGRHRNMVGGCLLGWGGDVFVVVVADLGIFVLFLICFVVFHQCARLRPTCFEI